MIWLVDTNILLRLTEIGSDQHLEARHAIDRLLANGVSLAILLQNIAEFWNVCTRPQINNGLGFSIAQADAELSQIEKVFDLVPDNEEVCRQFRTLLIRHSVIGVKVHDARIVAGMKAHGIANLLTFNIKDFDRYDINAVAPRDV